MFHHPAWAVGSYRVGLVVWQLGWVDLDLGSSPGWWAATVATYFPSRMVEHPKSKSTQPRYPGKMADSVEVISMLLHV